MSMENIIAVGDQNFEQEIVASGLPALVDFWGPACGPCKALEPILEQIATTYQGKLKVAKVNVDNNPSTAVQYAVRSLPTLLIFKNGKVIHQITGRVTLGAIEKVLGRFL